MLIHPYLRCYGATLIDQSQVCPSQGRRLTMRPQRQCVLIHPYLRCYGATQLCDEGQLILFCGPLHDGIACPHLRHDATRAPLVNGCPIIPVAQKQLWRSVPQGHHSVCVAVELTWTSPIQTVLYGGIQLHTVFSSIKARRRTVRQNETERDMHKERERQTNVQRRMKEKRRK